MSWMGNRQFWALYRKEITEHTRGRGLAAAAIVIMTLAAVAGFVRAEDFKHAESQSSTFTSRWKTSILEQSARDENVQVESTRRPSPLEFLAIGLEPTTPFEFLSTKEGLRWGAPRSTSDAGDAVFGYLDASFVTAVVISLCGLLVSFESIAREKAMGTLTVISAFPIRRSKIVLAKIAANWSIVALCTCSAVLTCCLSAYGFGFPVWRIEAVFLFTLIGLLYGLGFVSLGMLLSIRCRTPSAAAVSTIVAWTTLVLVLPRLVTIAGAIRYPASREAEIAFRGDAEISVLKVKYAAAMQAAFQNYAGHYSDSAATGKFYEIRREEARKLDVQREQVLKRVWSAQDAIADKRRALMKAMNVMCPTSLLLQAAADLSGTGDLQRRNFVRGARDYHERVGRRLAERREVFLAGAGAAPADALVTKAEAEPWMQPFQTSWVPLRTAGMSIIAPLLLLIGFATATTAFSVYAMNIADITEHVR